MEKFPQPGHENANSKSLDLKAFEEHEAIMLDKKQEAQEKAEKEIMLSKMLKKELTEKGIHVEPGKPPYFIDLDDEASVLDHEQAMEEQEGKRIMLENERRLNPSLKHPDNKEYNYDGENSSIITRHTETFPNPDQINPKDRIQELKEKLDIKESTIKYLSKLEEEVKQLEINHEESRTAARKARQESGGLFKGRDTANSRDSRNRLNSDREELESKRRVYEIVKADLETVSKRIEELQKAMENTNEPTN